MNEKTTTHPDEDGRQQGGSTVNVASISFRTAGKIYDFDAGELSLSSGDTVIVETDRGRSMGTVVKEPRAVPSKDTPKDLKAVIGLATPHDLELSRMNAAKEDDAFAYCQKRILERKMEMKLVRAEYLYDGSKIIFFFTADGRVDFRELVRELAHHFRTRIEMRQIGVRDEAKQVGGLGVCGRELCCSTFLRGFAPISVKMAKEQGLALNPTKISGQCGRLLCCLEYEFDAYRCLRKGLPKVGKKVEFAGESVDVVALNVIGQKLTIRRRDGSREEVTVQEFNEGKNATCGGCGKHDAQTDAQDAKQQKPSRAPRREDKSHRARKDRQENAKSGEQPATASKPRNAQKEQDKKDGDTRKRQRRRPRRTTTASSSAKNGQNAQAKSNDEKRPMNKDKTTEERPAKRRSRSRRRPRKKPPQEPKKD